MTANVSYENLSDSLKQKLTESNVDIVNDLTTGGADKALSAEQGKVLNDKNPEFGIEVINERHAIRRFPVFNEWNNDINAEALQIMLPDIIISGEFRVRATMGRVSGVTDAGASETVFYFDKPQLGVSGKTTEQGTISCTPTIATMFSIGTSMGGGASIGFKSYCSFLKRSRKAPIYFEVELISVDNNAKEVLEQMYLNLEWKAYTQPSSPPTRLQQSVFRDAQNAVTRSIGGGTYYVSPNGDDATGEVGNTAKKFKTINAAINQMPKFLDGSYLIVLDAGTYSEYVFLKGFIGSGSIEIRGGGTIGDAVNYKLMGVHATGCNVKVHLYGLNFYGGNNQPVLAIRCSHLICAVCTMTDTSIYAGVTAEASNVSVASCTISNKAQGIHASDMSTVYAGFNSGTGNTVGLRASAGATIARHNNNITGTTQEEIVTGGLIRS